MPGFLSNVTSSLAAKILVLTLLVATVVLMLSHHLSSLTSARMLEQELANQATMAGRRMAEELSQAGVKNLLPRFRLSLARMTEVIPSILRADVYVLESDRFTLAASSRGAAEDSPGLAAPGPFRGDRPATSIITRTNGLRTLLATVPFEFRDQPRALLLLETSLHSVANLMRVRSRIRGYMMLANVVLLTGAITLLFRTTVDRSLRHLVSTMRVFLAGQGSVRAHENLPGEFGQLARHLNDLLAEISHFHQTLKRQIRDATGVLALRNAALEKTNLLLYATQQRLIRAERLALIGQWTATFAHEVGSPLSALSTHLQILLEDPKVADPSRALLQKANAEVDRVCRIVEDLLATSRHHGRAQTTDLQACVIKAARILEPLLHSRRIAFHPPRAAGDLLISGYPERLQELFLNLFHYTLGSIPGSGGWIRAEIRGDEDQHAIPPGLVVRIEDSGRPLAPQTLAGLFEPRFTTREFGQAAGLGLAACREIVQQHGGRIQADTRPGGGAVFSIWFPRDPNTGTSLKGGAHS